MNTQQNINYQRIEEAINYIRTNFRDQPDLEKVAEKIHLSPFHFQRLFTDWAGVSPKKFLQFISLEHAKTILKEKKATLSDAAFETGLSGTSRLHDLFTKIEGMTPGEFKNGGESLSINYSFAESPFGNILVASTPKGICYMAFADDEQKAFGELHKQFPKANYRQMVDLIQQNALYIFTKDWHKLNEIKIHIRATDFQIKVWEALLRIPPGQLTTYRSIASDINNPKAFRAVGTAVGDNPVAFIIPCHRVIRSTGVIGNYHWGSNRKAALVGWEAARSQSNN
jgi:AraC family transcriptional regulator of adaptative response/methylated-DNA-[protein]-cysteine methyltransferase